MPETTDQATLGPDDTARIVEFARACRSAAKAVSMYPPGHPASESGLSKLTEVCARAPGKWRLSVAPGTVLLDGLAPARSDVAITELADLLHIHQVGELIVDAATDAATWLKFLRLVSSQPDQVRHDGGIGRAWALSGGTGIEIRQIDYGAVLRERKAGQQASWDAIVRTCLEGDSVDLDDDMIAVIAAIVGDAQRFADFVQQLEGASKGHKRGAVRSPAAALVAMLQAVICKASDRADARDEIVDNVAAAATRFSPDMVIDLIASRTRTDGQNQGAELSGAILSRLTDNRLAAFVSNSVVATGGATDRLAAAFAALVPEDERRTPILAVARSQAEASPFGRSEQFERIWQGVEQMLASYSDEAWVSSEYARELDTARAQAADVDAITDDPPERIAEWLSSTSEGAVRLLDLQLLLDLLSIESEEVKWREMADVAVAHVEDLLLLGDFRAAREIVGAIAGVQRETTASAEGIAQPTARSIAASSSVDNLVNGQSLAHIVRHLPEIGDEDFADVKELCLSLGAGVIKPLAEMLAAQDRTRALGQFTNLLLAFGADGRQSVEQLKMSANASVRRLAIHLLREFGGSDALPDLASLLDDAEPHVQREAVRAILLIGTDEAYSILDRALRSASGHSRDTIFRLLAAAGDERAAPLFAYIVRRGMYKKGLFGVYMKAVTALGRLGGDEAVDALKQGLHRGEWWAPSRTSALREASAKSLAQIGTPRAIDVLRDAAANGRRGVRSAARRHLKQ